MQKREAVIDSSCVIALDVLRALPLLSFLFSRVHLPKAVRTELFRRRATKDRLRSLLRDYAFLARCDSYDQGAVDVLLVERKVTGSKDRGEAESVIQASGLAALVVIDDPWGRDLARRFALQCGGTVWILQKLYSHGLRSASQIRDDFLILRESKIRLPWEAVNRFLKEIGQDGLELPH